MKAEMGTARATAEAIQVLLRGTMFS